MSSLLYKTQIYTISNKPMSSLFQGYDIHVNEELRDGPYHRVFIVSGTTKWLKKLDVDHFLKRDLRVTCMSKQLHISKDVWTYKCVKFMRCYK